MDTGNVGILPDLTGQTTVAALADLREQRWRLGRVQNDVEAAGLRLTGQTVGSGWRSPAQRAYEERLGDLIVGLQGAWRALDDAVSAVDAAIAGIKAGR
jgi:hypothetical protein